ncbi:regulatory protein TetR [Leptospira ellinghausenii]|uniref:Regulatory protein TetR n=1 Tax=Leptospira ellinghausenii TaxID=1917822 RepID=A0A2P2DGI6_9LEPT|nr:TetR/AcrR family transcriptional regulator [Leptospira ellinghausenii]GBF43742.1 regulatory protein TetR [Leptospira ellinghausenii]
MSDARLFWIKKGYEFVSIYGFEKLKIEKLARVMEKPKSSFYYLFVDLENYTKHLLDFHFQQCLHISQKESLCETIDPGLVEILTEHKIDLLFNKQLRIHRQNPNFNEVIIKTDEIVIIPFLNIWKNDLKLEMSESQWNGLFSLALENFYLQIHIEILTEIWLREYFSNLKSVILNIAGK